ncbi:electron transfer flavoprotein subunit beta/FixA family protein [Robbsia sp. KACC 23696]|uniref:electron transfer flavoprotein subunit beta/FixA family protein n=1 Tax=Robbsia sp. KACC 23696 TaxID=3149231 RepID=UPI00325B1165
MTKIAVMVSIGRHPVSGTWRYSRNDAAALACGLALVAEDSAQATLDVWHAGDPGNPALRDYLALGAGRINVMPLGDDEDAVAALGDVLKNYTLILTGSRADLGLASGMVPYALASRLGASVVPDAVTLTVRGGDVAVRQFLPKGVRRTVSATLPAVVAVHPLAEATPRFAYARMQAGRVVTAQRAATRDDAAASGVHAAWRWAPANAKPVRLAAVEKRSGHARMLSATTTESRGGNVVNAGSPVEKAQMILAYLREHQLVDY